MRGRKPKVVSRDTHYLLSIIAENRRIDAVVKAKQTKEIVLRRHGAIIRRIAA